MVGNGVGVRSCWVPVGVGAVDVGSVLVSDEKEGVSIEVTCLSAPLALAFKTGIKHCCEEVDALPVELTQLEDKAFRR